MAKPREGWITVQVALPVGSVRLMRILAALRNETHGETLNEALLMAAPKLRPAVEGEEEFGPFGTQELVQLIAPHYRPGGIFSKKPAPEKPALAQKRVGPKPAPAEPEGVTLKAEAYGWNWERLLVALEQVNLTQHQLAKALGLTNISPWSRSGVPPKWHPTIHRILAERGWVPEVQQQTIFDQD